MEVGWIEGTYCHTCAFYELHMWRFWKIMLAFLTTLSVMGKALSRSIRKDPYCVNWMELNGFQGKDSGS